MRISGRITAFLLAAVMALGVVSFTAVDTSAISDANFVAPQITIPDSMPIPDNDMLTDGVSYYLGAATRYEMLVKADFMADGFKNRSSDNLTYNYQKYIVVHNTGAYPSTSTALANHNYGKTTTTSVSWHFTCGNDGIYQMLPVNIKGWHAGGNYWTQSTTAAKVEAGWVQDGSNSTGIGIETATPGFPATDTFSGEMWDSDELYEWYASTYDYTATYLAMLVASLCVRLNFNPYTQIIQHYNTAGKNCPMQMRYVFGTNATFVVNGTYYKVFLDRMYDYYKAYGGSYISTDTVQNTYYNPNGTVYKKGLYKATSATTVYRAGNTATGSVGTVAAGNVVDVQTVGFNWGRVVLSNGTVGWVQLSGLTYVGNTYRLGTYRTSSGTIVNVTNINGTTATYSGGTASITSLTKVYKVTVTGDTAFGSTSKYLAEGESFTVTAAGDSAGRNFDIWELTSGYAVIADKTAKSTKITVSGSDIVIGASYRDEYDLVVQSGTGAGSYKAGTAVTVRATAKVGYVFAGWKLVSGSGTFANANSATTTFTTTAQSTTICATYETAGALDTTGYTNYALGKSYTMTWKGATSFDYYSTTQNDSSTLKKLTDGSKATGSFATSQSIYVSVTGSNAKALVTIDLGQNRNIAMVALCDTVDNGGSFGDVLDGSITVEVSTDGSTYTSVQDLTDTLLYSYSGSTQLDGIFTHRLDFVPETARYVRIGYTSTKWVTAVSEIEVYGSDSIKTYTVTVQNGTGGGSFVQGKTISISANAPADGYEFSGWTLVSGSGTIGNASAATTTFTVGSSAATLKANYIQLAKLELTAAATSAGYTMADGMLAGVGAKTSVTALSAMFKYGVTVTDNDGSTVTGDVPVGTGYTVTCNGESVTVVVGGDLNGDGQISAPDYVALKSYMKNSVALSGVFAAAADVDGDGNIGAADIIAMSAAITG